MFQISNFTGNDDVRVLDSKGPFMTIEYIRGSKCCTKQCSYGIFL